MILAQATRWNSWYDMLERGLRLREALDLYARDPKNQSRDRAGDQSALKPLSNRQWEIVEALIKIFKPLKTMTKDFESDTPKLWKVIPSLHQLYNHLKKEVENRGGTVPKPATIHPVAPHPSTQVTTVSDSITAMGPPPTPSRRSNRQAAPPTWLTSGNYDFDRIPGQPSQTSEAIQTPRQSQTIRERESQATLVGESFEDDDERVIAICLRFATEKLVYYINLLEDSFVYWFAMILHPGHRLRWFELHTPHKVASLTEQFTEYYQRSYNELTTVENDMTSTEDDDDDFVIGGRGYYNGPVILDEVAVYLKEGPTKGVEDPLEWWKGQRQRFPQLCQFAFDFLSIPASSSACERIFSRAKLTIASQRHSLHWDTLNMLECYKNWMGIEDIE